MKTRTLGVFALVAVLLGVQYSALPQAHANGLCATGGCSVYVPLATFPAFPQLLEPTNGSAPRSVAPLLTWSPVVTGTYQIQLAPDIQFLPQNSLPLSETKRVTLIEPQISLININLPSHATFYWRVGFHTPYGYEYSPIWHFTTPPKDSSVLPSPVPMVSPANNSTLARLPVVLLWQGVPGALYYRVRVYNAQGGVVSAASKDVPSSATSLKIDGLMSGGTYHWKVKALNQYGWGAYAPDFYFTTP